MHFRLVDPMKIGIFFTNLFNAIENLDGYFGDFEYLKIQDDPLEFQSGEEILDKTAVYFAQMEDARDAQYAYKIYRYAIIKHIQRDSESAQFNLLDNNISGIPGGMNLQTLMYKVHEAPEYNLTFEEKAQITGFSIDARIIGESEFNRYTYNAVLAVTVKLIRRQ